LTPSPLHAAALLRLANVRHGFFTREGGVSDGVWASLNVGIRSGDAPERIAANRARCALALGCAPNRFVSARQVHGTRCLTVDTPWAMDRAPEADALVTTRPGLMLGVLTADCGPLLLADAAAGVVATAHAGWRGALDGIVEATVEAMIRHGAVPCRITAALGPCIGQRSYEVGPEFRDRFLAAEPAAARLFEPVAGSDRLLFDLKGHIRGRLERAGVGTIEVLAEDTCIDEARFFSYRRTTRRGGGRFGLQVAGIRLAGD
jgi:YfiH family protein